MAQAKAAGLEDALETVRRENYIERDNYIYIILRGYSEGELYNMTRFQLMVPFGSHRPPIIKIAIKW